MKKYFLFPLLALPVALSLPLLADAPPRPAEPNPTEMTASGREAVVGEIVDVQGSGFRIRPWDPKLPARLEVALAESTRHLEQARSRLADLQAGELVLVVPEPEKGDSDSSRRRKQPKKGKGAVTLAAQEAPGDPVEARAVVRCWPAEGAEVAPRDQEAARALLTGALPYFRGEARGGVNKPNRRTEPVIGVVTALKPLTVRSNEATHRFAASGDTLVIEHRAVRPAELKRGLTVLVQSDPAVEGVLQALTVAVCPKPIMGPRQTRQILLRERRREER